MITWLQATTNPRAAARSETSSNTYDSQSSHSASQTFLTVQTFSAEGVGGTTTQQYSTFYQGTYSEESASGHVRVTNSAGVITGSTSYSNSYSASASVMYSLSGMTNHTQEDASDSAYWTQAATSVTTQSGSTSGSVSIGLTAQTTYQSFVGAYSFLYTMTFSSTYQGSDPWGTYSDSSRDTVTFEETYTYSTEFSSTESRGTLTYSLGESYVTTYDAGRLTTTQTTVEIFAWSAGSSQEVYDGSTVYYRSTALSGTSTITVTYNTAFQASTTAHTTTVTYVDFVGSSTMIRSRAGGTYRGQVSFVTAGLPGYNEWPALIKDTTGLFLRVTQAHDMVDGSFTYALSQNYVPVGTSLLPTSVHSSISSQTVVVSKTRTIVSQSRGETFFTSSYSTFNKTVASPFPASLVPYTGSTLSAEAVFGTSSTSLSTPSATLVWISSMSTTEFVPRTTMVPAFTAVGDKTFSWMQSTSYGYTTQATTSYLNSGDARLILPETTISGSTTSTTSSTFAGGSYSGSSFSTLTQQSGFGRTLETQNSGGQAGLGYAGPVESWVRSYRNGDAWIAPSPDLDDENAGSNLAGLPIAFRIPVSYSSRADGAHVYLQTDGSLVRSYLLNASGGNSASVVSSAYTTLMWRLSLDSVSATTMSRQNSTSTVSGSTVAVISPAGNAADPAYYAYDGGTVQGAIGGRQALAAQTAIFKAGLYIVYEFPDGANMNSQTVSSVDPASRTVGSSVNLSYREQCLQWMIIGRAQAQIATFARNHLG